MLVDRSIGGYFGLELSQGLHYHTDALRFNTARNCLEFILERKLYEKVYVPYYGCDSILEPFFKLQINYNIFVAKYWPNIPLICGENDIEYDLFEHLIPLPIDQRYGEYEMNQMTKIICDECFN